MRQRTALKKKEKCSMHHQRSTNKSRSSHISNKVEYDGRLRNVAKVETCKTDIISRI
jgi:hypothetical protein